jgi:hypothetical protein
MKTSCALLVAILLWVKCSTNFSDLNKYKVNNELNNAFLSNIKNDSIRGASLLKFESKLNGTQTNHNQLAYSYSFKRNDTVFIFFPFVLPDIKLSLIQDNYKIEVSYITDIAKTFLDGNASGTYYEAKLNYHDLILKNNSFNIGDTLRGIIEFETKPFRYGGGKRIDHISGPFMAIIRTADDLPPPYLIP